MSRRKKLAVALSVLSLLGLGGGYLLSDVDTALTAEDENAIASLGVDDACGEVEGFTAELGCVRAIQAASDALADDYTCVHEYGRTSHEPTAFLARQTGCCYDRSRLIEKALTHYGFNVRHLAIYRGDSVSAFVSRGVSSHSLSEVETSRGWMLVDSIRLTVGLTRTQQPLDALALRPLLQANSDSLAEQDYSALLHGDYVTFYGLYSRHGGFYAPHVPLPDVDWAQLHHNL